MRISASSVSQRVSTAARPVASAAILAALLAFSIGCSDEPAAVAKSDVVGSDTSISDTGSPDSAGSDASATDALSTDTSTDVATCPASCDDQNPCTTDTCDPAVGTCVHAPASGANCDDSDPCTSGEKCDAGKCQGGSNTCACSSDAECQAIGDKNQCAGKWYCDQTAAPYACKVAANTAVNCPASQDPCQVAKCVEPGDPKGKPNSPSCTTVAAVDNTPCDDGDGGTTGDACLAGVCQGTNVAQCASHADCAKLEDGDLCNGTLFCNMATQKCQLNPNTVITCPSAFDSVCGANTCNPKTGQCAMKFLNENQPCDDGSPCTGGDHCASGSCASTTDTCPCSKDADCDGKDDGNLCNGTMYCDLALNPPACKVNPATIVSCKSVNDTACSKNLCDPKTGQCAVTPVSKGAPCDDGNPCTAVGTCQEGACTVGANICPCQTDGECDGKDDGNFCNGTLFCNKAEHECVLNPATIVTCATAQDNDCQTNTCDPLTGKCGMVLATDGALCEDGSVCTANDSCKAGACVSGVKTCACEQPEDCVPLEDGNACNGTLYCDLKTHTCLVNPATILLDNAVCDDGNMCTKLDFCTSGKCAGTAIKCDDGNPCTTDACDMATGCTHTATTGVACDDYKPCTVNDICTAGTCAGTDKVCDDNNPCTSDSCLSWSGSCTAESKPDGTSCDDGKPCTSGDKCASAVCKGKIGACACKGTSDCFDNDYCTQDVCNTTAGTCANIDKNCDDGKPCTLDTCAPASGVCSSKNDDTLQPPSPCWVDECSYGTPSCKAGALLCLSTKADPTKVGQVCSSGEGTCSISGCVIPKAPVVSAATFASAIKPGTAAALSVTVQDSNNDNAVGTSDLVSVVADLSGLGGSATTPLTFGGPGPDNQSQLYAGSVATAGLTAGTYGVPITATDASGKVGQGSALLVVYTGTVLHVGAAEEFSTISAAISAAVSGDTIAIHDGTYAGNANKNLVPGNKVISIVGVGGPSKTTIDCAGAGRAFNLSSPGTPIQVTIAGLTIKGCVASAVRVVTTGADIAQVKVTDCVFDTNSTTDTGGAIDASGAGTSLLVNRCTFTGNSVTATSGYPKGGGGLAMADGKLDVVGSTFSANTAGQAGNGAAMLLRGTTACTVVGSTFLAQVGLTRVVSLIEKATITVSGSKFLGDLKADSCLAGDGDATPMTITNSRFEGCKWAIVAYSSKTCTVSGSVFKNNKNTQDLYATVTFCEVDSSLFANNIGRAYEGRYNGGHGVKNSTFMNNDGSYYEVAVLGANSTGLTFTGNKGSKIVAMDSKSTGTIVLSNSSFTGNTATANTLETGTGSSIQDCVFVGNKAADGAAIRAWSGATGQISNILAVGNVATGQGGAIQVALGTWTIRNVTLVGNSAAQGGGIFLDASTTSLDSSILWDNVVAGAIGKTAGAQIYVKNVANNKPVLHFCTVRNDDQLPEGDIVDDGLKMNGGDTFIAGQLGNLSSNPLFVQTAKGSYFLAQTAAGQPKQSPCVDPAAAGGLTPPLASAVGLDKRTTRTDGGLDAGAVDAGYHYAP